MGRAGRQRTVMGQQASIAARALPTSPRGSPLSCRGLRRFRFSRSAFCGIVGTLALRDARARGARRAARSRLHGLLLRCERSRSALGVVGPSNVTSRGGEEPPQVRVTHLAQLELARLLGRELVQLDTG